MDACRATPGLAAPIIVLGCHARRVLAALRAGSRSNSLGAATVRNFHWRKGQISSLRTGLRRVPRRAAGFLLYPVDYPLITASLLNRLLRAFHRRSNRQRIVAPCAGRRTGHPILVSRELAGEFHACARRGGTARDVIYRATKPDRVRRVPVRDEAIFCDFDSLASYFRCLRLWRKRTPGRPFPPTTGVHP